MPKQTFHNLTDKKRERFIAAFLKEFTLNNYDNASISRVLQQLGMAKGSFYQYFENKQDLFLYLVGVCSQTKMNYINAIRREDYSDFWTYWIDLYEAGLKMDTTHPAMSNFMFMIHETINSPSIKPVALIWQKEGTKQISAMIQPEIDAGHFRQDIPAEHMAHTLVTIGQGLLPYIQTQHPDVYLKIKQAKQTGQPIFQGESRALLMEIVHHQISLLKNAFNNPVNQ